jgi:hypothetical protein
MHDDKFHRDDDLGKVGLVFLFCVEDGGRRLAAVDDLQIIKPGDPSLFIGFNV